MYSFICHSVVIAKHAQQSLMLVQPWPQISVLLQVLCTHVWGLVWVCDSVQGYTGCQGIVADLPSDHCHCGHE